MNKTCIPPSSSCVCYQQVICLATRHSHVCGQKEGPVCFRVGRSSCPPFSIRLLSEQLGKIPVLFQTLCATPQLLSSTCKGRQRLHLPACYPRVSCQRMINQERQWEKSKSDKHIFLNGHFSEANTNSHSLKDSPVPKLKKQLSSCPTINKKLREGSGNMQSRRLTAIPTHCEEKHYHSSNRDFLPN